MVLNPAKIHAVEYKFSQTISWCLRSATLANFSLLGVRNIILIWCSMSMSSEIVVKPGEINTVYVKIHSSNKLVSLDSSTDQSLSPWRWKYVINLGPDSQNPPNLRYNLSIVITNSLFLFQQ